jgi:DNA primase small subunit
LFSVSAGVVHGGWITKVYRGKDDLIKDLERFEEKKDRIKRLVEFSRMKDLDIKEKKCESIIDDLFYSGKGNTARRMLDEDKFSLTSSKTKDNDFLKLAASYSSVNLSGETDEPVTTDIKRLIRCPGSLHGKTGLKVIEIEKDETRIDEFDPLRDAVVLPSDEIDVELNEDFSMEMGGNEWHLDRGKNRVPRYLAYFLIARRLALIS